MNLNFTVSLDDIGIGLDLSGNSESERQEVMDFLVSVDENMADMDFSCSLIYRLAVEVSHEAEAHAADLVTVLPDGTHTTFGSLYELLSYMPEDKLIALMANAMMVRRERDAIASLSLDTACLCGEENKGAHE